MLAYKEVEKYLKAEGAEFYSFEQYHINEKNPRHLIEIKLSNDDVVKLEIWFNPTATEVTDEMKYHLNIYKNNIKTYSNNCISCKDILLKIKKMENMFVPDNNVIKLNEEEFKQKINEYVIGAICEAIEDKNSRNYYIPTEDINRLVYVPSRFTDEFKKQFNDLDNQQLYNSIMELSDYDAVDAETDINNRNALLLWIWEYASEKLASSNNSYGGYTISLNENDIKQVVSECIKNIISEAPGSYFQPIMTKNENIMDQIANKISLLDGVSIVPMYSNNEKITVSIKNYAVENEVYEIMAKFGYKYLATAGGTDSGKTVVFKKQ